MAWPGHAREAGPPALSLANVYHDDVDLAEYWVSEKLDGVRAYWDGESLFSRGGNRFNPPPGFVEGFPALPLDGELWMDAVLSRRSRASSAVKVPMRMIGGASCSWCSTCGPRGNLRRTPGAVEDLLAGLDASRIGLVEQYRVANHAALAARLEGVVDEGAEGLMLRRGSSRYRAGRSERPVEAQDL